MSRTLSCSILYRGNVYTHNAIDVELLLVNWKSSWIDTWLSPSLYFAFIAVTVKHRTYVYYFNITLPICCSQCRICGHAASCIGTWISTVLSDFRFPLRVSFFFSHAAQLNAKAIIVNCGTGTIAGVDALIWRIDLFISSPGGTVNGTDEHCAFAQDFNSFLRVRDYWATLWTMCIHACRSIMRGKTIHTKAMFWSRTLTL